MLEIGEERVKAVSKYGIMCMGELIKVDLHFYVSFFFTSSSPFLLTSVEWKLNIIYMTHIQWQFTEVSSKCEIPASDVKSSILSILRLVCSKYYRIYCTYRNVQNAYNRKTFEYKLQTLKRTNGNGNINNNNADTKPI